MEKEVKCRYGVTYKIDVKGSYGEKERFYDMMSHCCCWVCHNHECKEPRNEILLDCKKECDLFTDKPYCEREKKELVESSG